MTPDPYDYWKRTLAGETLPIHDGDVQCGFYKRRKFKNGPFVGVAIWLNDDGKPICTDGGALVEHPDRIWTYCAARPITEEAYRAAEANGDFIIPDGVHVPGHNSAGMTEDERIKAEIADLQERAAALSVPTNKTEADAASNIRDKLNSLSKEADKIRAEEKKPHDDAARAVQQKWKPLVDSAKAAADDIRDKKLTPYLRAEEKKQREAAEEAARKAAEEAAAKGAGAERLPTAPAPEPAPVRAGGVYGKAASLRTIKRAEITDFDALYAALKDNPDMRECVEQCAQKLARAGIALPGMKIIEERKAA
ncbi:MAG: hypothetical protein AB7O39_03390 [Flavobacteriaceae bacterium]